MAISTVACCRGCGLCGVLPGGFLPGLGRTDLPFPLRVEMVGSGEEVIAGTQHTPRASQQREAVMDQLKQEVMELEACPATIPEIPSLHVKELKKWSVLRALDEH